LLSFRWNIFLGILNVVHKQMTSMFVFTLESFFLLTREFIISYEPKTSLKQMFTMLSFFRHSQITDITLVWVMINDESPQGCSLFHVHQHIIEKFVCTLFIFITLEKWFLNMTFMRNFMVLYIYGHTQEIIFTPAAFFFLLLFGI
jgi:hypothetical protein